VPDLHVQSPEFKPQSHKNKKEEERLRLMLLGPLWDSYSWPILSVGSASLDSTNLGSKIFGRKKIVFVLIMYILFIPVIFSKTMPHNGYLHRIYIAIIL
jgi:hypothetical protein